MNFFEKNARFKPLIHYFGMRLNYPGAVVDLWEFLWYVMLIYGDEYPDFYYKKCIRNEFIKLSKLNKSNLFELCDHDDFDPLQDGFEPKFDNKELLKNAFNILTKKQKSVIWRHFFEGYSIAEIANQDCCTWQAVDRIKLRALERMRDYMRLDKIRL